ncbi:ATP-binding cassette sub-family C member 9-like isoform X3 [Apostichopus japonicus]|uniref:ATP-binding cassette sub-family C member 9-like isoform X3 n=1 Tax=Stichopus japonicus TaxID=307972 RepID=UPI003AB869AC
MDPLKMEKFNWYCGANTAENLIGFAWDPEHTIYNSCFTNLLETIPHILLLVFGSLVLFALLLCRHSEKHAYLLKFPGHDLRWVLYYPLMVMVTFQVGEGILTDLIVNNGLETQPQLYVPACLALLAGIVAIIYTHHMEYWELQHMSWLMLVYWLLALGGSAIKLANLVNDEEVDSSHMRYILTIVAVIIYALFFILELNVIRTRVFGWGYEPETFPEDLEKEGMRFLQGYTNLLSTAIFWWMNWLFSLGYKRALELDDLGSLSKVHTTKYNRDKFEEAVGIELKKAEDTGKELNLYKAYLRTYGKRLGVAGIIKFFADSFAFINPFILSGIILYASQLQYQGSELTNPDVKYMSSYDFIRNGIVLVFLLFLCSYSRALCLQVHYHLVITESGHVKAAIQAAVYDKALRISTYTISGGSMTTGQITNHMSVDAMNILMSFQYLHSAWSLPYQLLGYLVILYTQLGPAALIGFSVFFLVLPLQTVIAKQLGNLQKKSMVHSDSRLKQTNEMLQGMKLIKLYAWEEIFLQVIGEARGKEIWMQVKSTGWRVLMYTLAGSTPLLVTLISYSLYQVLEGKALTPEITFSSLSVFNSMFVPMFMLPQVIQFYVNAVVSTKRLRTFFSAAEIEDGEDGRTLEKVNRLNPGHVPQRDIKANGHESFKKIDADSDGQVYSNPAFETETQNGNLKESNLKFAEDTIDKLRHENGWPVAKISHGSFTWDAEASTPTLSDIDLEIPAGKLTIVVGQVGGGKSSFISALLGEMSTVSGSVQWDKSVSNIAYGSQKAWLLNATMEENITFGNKMDRLRYKDTINACSLQPDIDILPAGDQTEIGEKGINLSGGQKQRVSVARTMYSPHSVVILDDPLSALDVHVGAHLFEEGIKGILLKENRTVILVTHQVQYLDQAEKIVVIKDGKVQHHGTYDSICAENPQLQESWQKMMREEEEESDAESLDNVSINDERKELMRQVSIRSKEEKILKRSLSDIEKKAKLDKEKGALMEKEERNKGSVSWRVYWHYIKTFNAFLFLLCVFLFVLQNAVMVGNNYWLSLWSEAGINATEENMDEILKKYLPVYGALTIASVLMSTLSTTVMLLASLRAAKFIHNAMLYCVIHAPLRFFDTTPVGRILNRFSSDTQVIDQKLGQTVMFFITTTSECIAAIVVNVLITWYILIGIIPLFLAYISALAFFITTSRELQRLESISRSPVFAHFSESLGGLTTIRAFNVQETFAKNILAKIEKNNVAYLYLQTSNRWLGTRLDFIGSLIVLIAGVVSLGSAYAGELAPSLVGLSITYALSISNSLNWVIRQAADVEMQMNAIERTSHYTSIDSEPYEGNKEPSISWPDKGLITLDNVHARYAKGLDPVLHGVTVTLEPTQKIGICGRTGSGKSSLTLCLFRVIDMFKGKISIDGEDISKLSLTTLRKHLSIIPQDPVLFNGSIRFNLDPFVEQDDDDLWRSLEISQLKEVVSELEFGLDSPVTEGGENFSVGQRQLFCLARAFLRKSKILIMDEATASIDIETDDIVQSIVRTAFKDRTVITIAHRVSTILDSDKIITLDNGRMVEFDDPESLLEQEDSIFASLVNSNQ